MDVPKKFQNRTLGEEVASYLQQELLVSGSYPPNTFIREEELAKKLNVSRAPIREGLKILEGYGLLRSIPQKGSFVIGFSQPEIEELYDIRFSLEEIIFRNIVRKGIFTADDYDHQRNLLAKMLNLAESNEKKEDILLEFSIVDLEFHMYFAERSERKITLQILKKVYFQIHQAVIRDIATESDIKKLVEEHLKILDSLQSGDLKSLQMNRFFSYFHRRIASFSVLDHE